MMEDDTRKRMYICVWLGHFAVQQKFTEHCKSTILQFKKFFKKETRYEAKAKTEDR